MQSRTELLAALAAEREQRRQLEAQLRERDLRAFEDEYRAIFDWSHDGILVHDATTGAIVDANRRVCELHGLTLEEIRSGGVAMIGDVVPPYTPDVAAGYMRRAAAGESLRFEWCTLHRLTGEPMWVEVGLQRVAIRGEERILAFVRDVRERKAAEAQLRQANEGLERRVEERTAALAVANHALAAREEHFRRLIENGSDLLMISAPDMRLAYVSPSAERLLGYTPEEMLAKRPDDLVHPDDVAAVYAGTQAILGAPGTLGRLTWRIRHKDGRWRLIEAIARTLDPHSAADGVVCNGRDVTEQREAELALQRSEEHFRRLIENAYDLTSIATAEGRIAYHSPSVLPVLGYTPEELEGRLAFDYIHPDDAPHVARELARIVASPTTVGHAEYRFRHKDGSWRLLEAFGRTLARDTADDGPRAEHPRRDRAPPHRGGAAPGHGRRRAGARRGRAGEPRQERVPLAHEPRAPHADEQHPRLRPAPRRRRPLGGRPQRGAAHPHRRRAPAHPHQRGARHRAHRGRAPGAVDRAGAPRDGAAGGGRAGAPARGGARGAAGGRGGRARRRGRLLRAGRPAAPRAGAAQPPEQRRQVQPAGRQRPARDRAVRRGARRGRPRARRGHGARHRAGAADQLFVPFARLGAEQTGVEGTGLGLALSRRLMAAMGGTLELASSSPHGSVFQVELRAAASPVAGVPLPLFTRPLALDRQREVTLVYVEDNLANLSLIEAVLAPYAGWTLIPALQGQLGVELAREHAPDLVLLDLHLPDIPGDEVLRRLRADPRTAAVPVVVISADATPKSIERLRAAGADAYLTKPLDVKLFLRTLERLLAGPARS
jgi:PAS domain S-box-containing protein